MRLKDRLRKFATTHNLTHEALAEKLCTPYETFKKWMRDGEGSRQPPGCLIVLMDILEKSDEARKIAGIK